MGIYRRNVPGILPVLADGRIVRRQDILDKETKQMMLTEKEARLIEIIRKLDFGEVRVVVQDSVPIRLEEIKRSIKL